MKAKSFSILYKSAIKVLSIVAIVVLVRGTVWNIFTFYEQPRNFSALFFIVLNILTALCFVFLYFRPDKLSLFAMISIVYSIPNLIAKQENVGIGYFMFMLFVMSLYVLNFFKRWKRTKICCVCVCFIFIMLVNLIHGFELFEEKFFDVLGYSIILLVIILMLLKYQLESKHSVLGHKILDLRKHIEDGSISDRDVKWLKQILNREKYSSIANESAVADGTMRNRIREVFKIIGVTDKRQFVTIYDEALVITTQEEFQAWKDTLV